MKLFDARRFGLFIHWGIYSIPGWHEQLQWRKPVPKAEYIRYKDQFNPIHFNPDAWLDAAETAGMTYLCFTTKHHDGFCMWDTKFTDYGIMHTPYGRDILAMLAEACHRRGFGLCLYYSIPDWHHPNSVNCGGDHQLPEPNPGDEPDDDKYREYVRNQVRELCTNYGKISGFFWDIHAKRQDVSFNEMIRSLQPGIAINDRGYDKGDYDTPERNVPAGKRFARWTEANQSVGQQSWGFREHEDYYSHKFLMQSIDRIMSMGGNYLLNIGPRADGTFPPESEASLRAVGQWFMNVREALVDAQPASNVMDRDDFMITRKDNALYLHFHRDPETSGVLLNPLNTLPRHACVMNTGAPLYCSVEAFPTMCVPWNRKGPCLHLGGLPVNTLNGEVIVVKLEFDDLDAILADVHSKDHVATYRAVSEEGNV